MPKPRLSETSLLRQFVVSKWDDPMKVLDSLA